MEEFNNVEEMIELVVKKLSNHQKLDLIKGIDLKENYEKLNKNKYKELIKYILSVPKENFSLTHLCMILWMSDSRYYMEHGESITGETYIKGNDIPMPTHLLEILVELEVENQIKIF